MSTSFSACFNVCIFLNSLKGLEIGLRPFSASSIAMGKVRAQGVVDQGATFSFRSPSTKSRGKDGEHSMTTLDAF